jgi:hypothetical protein
MTRIACATLLILFAPMAIEAGTLCTMTFDMAGWSAFYKTADGSGKISCDNGEKATVRLTSKGGGVTFGRSKIIGATGRFTEVDSIDELFGTYVQAEAHAGATKSTKASALTKGEVSLSLVGKGRGIDVGVSFGKFTIERRGK